MNLLVHFFPHIAQHIPIPEGGARVGRALSLAGSVSDYPAVMEVTIYIFIRV